MGYVGSYIWQIRHEHGWGTKPLLMPGVAMVIENDQQEILLGKRTDNQDWCVFGGGCELGDSVLTTMHKELKEETGLTAKDYVAFGIMSDPEQSYIKLDHGDEIYGVNTLFHVTGYTGDPHPADAEHSEIAWVAPADIPWDDLMPIAKHTLDAFFAYKKTGQFQLN